MMSGDTGVYAIRCGRGDVVTVCWSDDGPAGGGVECSEPGEC
jgi:hypothetical protein